MSRTQLIQLVLVFTQLQCGINKINLMQASSEHELPGNSQFQDIQIDSSNCCNPSFRASHSSHSIENPRQSQKSLKNSKEKGIKLTHKTKSFTALPHEIKLVSKKSEPVKLNQRMARKQEASQISLNALSNLQRCISYKNKKIREHTQEENQHSALYLLSPTKQAEMYSTRKNTARTLTSSQDLPLVEKTVPNLFNNSSVFKQFEQQKKSVSSPFKSIEYALLISEKKTPGRKTLEKVFEETQGKRIVTLQSQFSNDEECSNEYSIAEAYEFPLQG